jgi:hypothetical protein
MHRANCSSGSDFEALVLGLLDDPRTAGATAHERAVSAIRI